jgi:hypothetical protein
MIPYFDTLVPMLKTFDGQCDLGIDVLECTLVTI